MDDNRISFRVYLEKRISQETVNFFKTYSIKKSYYMGAYSRAVIKSSFHSNVSQGNTTFKKWLSNQIINYKNLDRIYEMAFRFEQKLQLKIRNNSEVRQLVHEIPMTDSKGISNAKISYAFVAGYDDYNKFISENPVNEKKENKDD